MAVTVAAAMVAAAMEAAVTVAVAMEVAATVAAAIMQAVVMEVAGTAMDTTDTGSAITPRATTTTGVTAIGAEGFTVLRTTTERERSAAALGSRI